MDKCPIADLAQDIDCAERVLQRADGTRVPILKTAVPVLIGGRPCILESFLDLSKQKELEDSLGQRVAELQEAMAHVRMLQGIIPICMHCHKIRNDEQVWERLEAYLNTHSEAQFSHGICAECLAEHYPDLGST